MSFKFRGIEFEFALSQGLFSSLNIDTGTRFLLKVFSHKIDEALAAGQPPARSVLDAGSGVGILGICAARALGAVTSGWDGRVRAQDRDELARIFTLHNAALNGVPPAFLTAHTEPLLAGPPEGGWDLILSNVPAKTGKSVLLDFVSRSADLLTSGGQAMIVVVNPLAHLFSARIAELELPLLYEEQGREHRVFIYRRKETGKRSPAFGLGGPDRPNPGVFQETKAFLEKWPAYLRGSGDYTLEKVSYHLDAFHGVADFDTPGGAVQAAVKVLSRLGGRGDRRVPAERGGEPGTSSGGTPAAVLVYEPDQGHFPVWLAGAGGGPVPSGRWVFSGRNILSLEAARHNTLRALEAEGGGGGIVLLPAVDLALDRAALAALGGYGLIAFFPEAVPQAEGTERLDAWWEALTSLLSPGGFLVAAFSASRAERFDRRKPRGFIRLGDVRRKGFRAYLYSLRSQYPEGAPPV